MPEHFTASGVTKKLCKMSYFLERQVVCRHWCWRCLLLRDWSAGMVVGFWRLLFFKRPQRTDLNFSYPVLLPVLFVFAGSDFALKENKSAFVRNFGCTRRQIVPRGASVPLCYLLPSARRIFVVFIRRERKAGV